MAHHLVHGAESELGHVLAHLLGDKKEEVDYVFRLPLEPLAQNRVLCRDAYRACVQVTLAHHDAAHCDERHGRKTELFGSKQRRNHHVAAGLQFAVGLYPNAAAQIIEQQNLLRLSKPQFPGQTGVLDRTERRSARPAAVAGDEHHVSMRL